jgi:hypothetical protein
LLQCINHTLHNSCVLLRDIQVSGELVFVRLHFERAGPGDVVRNSLYELPPFVRVAQIYTQPDHTENGSNKKRKEYHGLTRLWPRSARGPLPDEHRMHGVASPPARDRRAV